MKHLMIRLVIALAGGVSLTLVVVGPLSSSRSAEHPVAHSAEWQVCLSACPYVSIQDAVDAATDGDVIKVAAGTYTGVNVRPRNDITFTGVVTQVVYISKTIVIQGGYSTTNWTTPDPIMNPTTLDAEGQGRVLYITGDISPTIEGLRLTGGSAAGLGGDLWGDSGGGIYVITATTLISNNRVFSNTAAVNGGGLFLGLSPTALSGNTIASNTALLGGGVLLKSSPATLSGNNVVGNIATNFGGGLYLYSSAAILNNNIVASNTAVIGGGLVMQSSPATLNANTVASNTASFDGGGLYVYSSSATFSGNMVVSNAATSDGRGGGVFLYSSAVILSGNIVAANTAGSSGGGLRLLDDDSTLINNLVVNNKADGGGSGIDIEASFSRLYHTTIASNGGGDGSGILVNGSHADLVNTILVSQTVGITVTSGSTATLEASLWGSGAWANVTNWGGDGTIVIGTVNVFGDPGFVGLDEGDYHIGSDSAALDAGVNAGVMLDIDNQPRPHRVPDLGADEYWPPGTPKYVYLPFVARADSACPGNVLINGDFEQGHMGWYTDTTGGGWKQHDLIGSKAEGFDPYRGYYAARLGGYEGVEDAITRTVTIPVRGELNYWWKGKTYETLPHHDPFEVALFNQDGTLVASLAHHDNQDVQDTWQQDVVDVSADAGQSLTLRFYSYNDNYYFTVFNLDEICLSSVSSR